MIPTVIPAVLLAAVLVVFLAVAPAGAQEPPARPCPPGGEVVLGKSAAFTGPTRGLGIEYWRGVMAWLSRVNATGGVNGRTVRV
ncbi:MAG: hypothetical protein AB7D57_03340, partial [Desulfovibrionaceae bacterium]